MASKRHPLLLTGLLWGVLPACGSSSDSDAGTDSPARAFASELARVTCAAEAACCSAQGDTQDEGSCRRITEKVELGRGELFDAAKAEQCLSALASYTCDGDYPSVCMQVFYGKVPLGEPCEFGTDCARPGGALTDCVMDGDFDHWSCKLVVTSGPGEPCGMATVTQTELRVCAEGLSCGDTCQPKAPVGVALGADCSAEACVESAWCGPEGTCQAKKKAGDACQSDAECLEICHPAKKRCAGADFYCL